MEDSLIINTTLILNFNLSISQTLLLFLRVSIMAAKHSQVSLFHRTSSEGEHNPLNMSDEQILDQIYSTHVHSHTKFDVDSLFILVENTLRRSTLIVDNVVQV